VVGRSIRDGIRNAREQTLRACVSAGWRFSFKRVGSRRVVLFVSHAERRCGIHEFGHHIAEALQASTVFRFVYVECSGRGQLLRALARHGPAAIVYNHDPRTMPWMSTALAAEVRHTTKHSVPQVGIMHECPQPIADAAVADTFDYHIAPDPTLVPRNPIVFSTGRLIPTYSNTFPPPPVVTVGSLGFGGEQKRYDLVVQAVQREFDEAIVRINIAYNDVVDAQGVQAREAAARCRKIPPKEGVKVEITHDFFDQRRMLDFLAQNTLNAFLYDWQEGRGISAVVENAMAVDRPLAVSRVPMFRHVWEAAPSICADDTPLREIIRNGTGPLRPFSARWTRRNLLREYEAILDDVLRGKFLYEPLAAPASAIRFNRILDDDTRAFYRPAIQKLFLLSPDVMQRKIPEANIQQAFMLNAVQALSRSRRHSTRILCVGCYEDSAYTSLRRLGYDVVGIDPVLNYDLKTFVSRSRNVRSAFDIVFSTSVLEHVLEDEEFVGEIADLLRPRGHAILTCDFNDAYKPGDRLPQPNHRFYTQRDLYNRLLPAMGGCAPVDPPDWECSKPDFNFDGCQYTFAAVTVQKRP